MAQIKIELSAPPVDGMDIKFQAPCDCTEITGLLVAYPDGSQEFTFRDAHGNNLAGIGNLFSAGAYVKVIVDTSRGYAYIQNADNNSFLASATIGTYTHSGDTLNGSGENGKFKATSSGTIYELQINGERFPVKCGAEPSIDLIEGCWYTFILDGVSVNFNSGGAGASLAFKIAGGTTQPVSPSENTIWVNTDEIITGWAFSATEPADPVEGMVWFGVDTSSSVEFNALKKNGIQIYLIGAKQYVSGAWANVEAHVYQGSSWVQFSMEWNGILYDAGDEYTSITGGWDKYQTTGTLTKEATYLSFNGGSSSGVVGTQNAIDITNASSLKGIVTGPASANSPSLYSLGVYSDKAYANRVSYVGVVGKTQEEVTLDVSDLSGKYYIGISNGASNNPTKLYKAWIE